MVFSNVPLTRRESFEFDLHESTQVGEARRAAMALSEALGFDESRAGRVSIVVNELASNVLKHAKSGQLILNRDAGGLEILALDRGPGISNFADCFRDGYSTAGTAGTGLGAVARLADESDFFSTPSHGTIAYARFGTKTESTGLRAGGVCLRLAGETACGDGWQAMLEPNRARILIVDGLGHGPLAAQAADRAIELFQESPNRTPASGLQAAHLAMRSTRGAAMAIAQVDLMSNIVTYAGIGNTVGLVARPGDLKRMISFEGTIGLQARKFQEFTYPFQPSSVLILHTDGITTSWDLSKYPGLLQRHPSIISALILRDHRRGRDDATVVALSWKDLA